MSKLSQPTAPTVGFVSLGCAKNLVDSEVMMGLLDRAGARLTSHPEEAEILVVNTCSFIDTAKQESVDAILEMARHKREGRAGKLIVAGCLVERYRDEIRKNIPEVDAVVGTGELEAILEAAGIAPVPAEAQPQLFNILSGSGRADARAGKEAQAGTHVSGHDFSRSVAAAPFEGALEAAENLRIQGEVSKRLTSWAEAPLNPNATTYGLKPVPFTDHRIAEASSSAAGLASEVRFRAEGDLRERQGRFNREQWQGATHLLPTYLYDESTPRLISTPRASAYIKIAEGCDHPCTFCVIPNLRGKFRSRRFESAVAEAQRLVANGTQEITLIGQDTTCYGEDLGLKDGLALLLDALAQIDGLRWLRFLYAYPNRLTGRLLETMARHDNICKYLDVPLQHASPDVLKRMKRGAGAEIFLKTIEKVRTTVPDIALRTTFIVGFPGESLRDFEILEEFVAEARFDWLGVFGYSDEEGSGAHSLDEKVPRRTIEARKRRLMKLQQSISRRAKQQWVGRELVLLAEGESEETPLLWEGRTQFHAPEIDGKVYINDFGALETLESGRFYRAEITEAHDYDVVAGIVSGSL
ncbi:MAG: MiaB/RimO family radical SAM methylthiotransferase [Terracidiphilus sp.]